MAHIMPPSLPAETRLSSAHNSSLQCTQPRNPGPGHPGSMTAASWGNKFVFACPGEVTGLQGSHKKWGGSSEELSSSRSEVTDSRHPGSRKSNDLEGFLHPKGMVIFSQSSEHKSFGGFMLIRTQSFSVFQVHGYMSQGHGTRTRQRARHAVF